MKKIIIGLIISIVILVGIYNRLFSHTKIRVNDVNSITINDKTYKADNGTSEITDIVSIYNNATIFRKDGDTTPSDKIIIELRSGLKIEILGTTQGFHYVTEGSKSYKILSRKLSDYLK